MEGANEGGRKGEIDGDKGNVLREGIKLVREK